MPSNEYACNKQKSWNNLQRVEYHKPREIEYAEGQMEMKGERWRERSVEVDAQRFSKMFRRARRL